MGRRRGPPQGDFEYYATAQWENLDAREAIHGTVDEINRTGDGFGFSKDFLLKAGLMLAGVGSVRFRVTNFNRHRRSETKSPRVRTRLERAAIDNRDRNIINAHADELNEEAVDVLGYQVET